jgi:hypothetical protein
VVVWILSRLEMRSQKIGIAFVVFLFAASSHALTYFGGREEGFCRSYGAMARGYEACGWNPANLAISPRYTFNIATIGLEYNSNLRLSDYERLMQGPELNKGDKELFKNGEELDFSAGAQALSLSYKNFGFMSYVYSTQSLNVPKDVASLIFWGNELDRTYSLADIRGKSEVGFVVSLSGAHAFEMNGKFALGGGLKYVRGISCMEICHSSGSLTTTFHGSDEPQIFGDGEFQYRYADGGYGVGVDVGALYTRDNYFVGLAMINVFSETIWDVRPRKATASFELDPVDLETFDPETSFDWEQTEETEAFSTSFEPRVDVSAGLRKKRYLITASSGYPTLFSIGSETSYGAFLLRAGCAYERRKVWIGLGLGLVKNALHLDIGMRLHTTSHISAGLSISVVPKTPSEKMERRKFRG